MDSGTVPALSGRVARANASPALPTLGALSLDSRVDEALRSLLAPAVPRIAALVEPLGPRLILLTGSAACGEACGVDEGGRLALLSDLDLLVLTDRPGVAEEKTRLARALERELAGHLERAGLLANPIDAGILPLRFFARTAFTLELAEATAQGVALWGDAQVLSPSRSRRPAAFEGFRLLINRVAETLLPAGQRSWWALPAREAPAWPQTASVGDWREAYRWAKLTLDTGKAWLAARGLHEASFRKRLMLAADEAERLPGGALSEWLVDARAWGAWREAPSWPPPEARSGPLVRLGRDVVHCVAGASGARDDSGFDRDLLRSLVGQEEGAWRDRARAWRSLIACRPNGISRLAAVRLACRWANRAWPRSLLYSALALAWLDAGGASLRRTLASEIPTCRGLDAARWDASWERALAEAVSWSRLAGL